MQSIRLRALNGFYYMAGLVFLGLASSKSRLRGYSSPKPFPMAEIERCAEYDVSVVERWMRGLERYTGGTTSIAGKSILEVGPGSDLGVGLCLLAKGAGRYVAVDKYGLAMHAPAAFYDHLLAQLQRREPLCSVGELRAALEATSGEVPPTAPLSYLVRSDFDIAAALPEQSVDIVFSNAAFEHIEDVESTIGDISRAVRPGGVLIAEVDLRTHSRWIREKDPNNIYRYSDRLYNLFRYAGRPNRVRPVSYRRYLTARGWSAIEIAPASTLSPPLLPRNAFLADRFRDEENRMDFLTVTLCATKS